MTAPHSSRHPLKRQKQSWAYRTHKCLVPTKTNVCGHISELHQFQSKGRRKLNDTNCSEQKSKILHVGAKKEKKKISFILKTEFRLCVFLMSNKKIKNSVVQVSPVWLHIIKAQRLNSMERILSQYLHIPNQNVVCFILKFYLSIIPL